MNQKNLTEAQEVAFGGERVTHLYPNDCYFAHLSIYYHALQYAINKTVLDAGCGSGYGAYYFAQRGAKFVEAIDISHTAIQFCKKHFDAKNLRYQQMSLEEISGFPEASFDLIFTSNVLEHVFNVNLFFQKVHKLLKSDGVLFVAVPPVVDEISRSNNLINKYHLNIWTPRQWYITISRYFSEIDCLFHSFHHPEIILDFANKPEDTKVNEADFSFETVSLDDFYKKAPLTVIFAARQPKIVPSDDTSLRFVEESFTRELPEEPSLDPDKQLIRRFAGRLKRLLRRFVKNQ